MKKLLSFVLFSGLFVSISLTVSAGDCFSDPIYDKDYNAEAVSAVFVRSVECMEGSTVLATLSAGEVVHVIAETDGWYKVERSDGTTGWVGQQFLSATSKSFSNDSTETTATPMEDYPPLHDIEQHRYESAIWNLYYDKIISGYPDNSFQPDRTVNRAELLKIIIEAVYEDEFESFENSICFADVPAGEWYTKYVCFAKSEGIVEGYDGNVFRPASEISFVEALKIAMIGFDYDYVEGNPWYKNIVMTASENNFIPLDVTQFNQNFSRGQMAELINRILKFNKDELEAYLGNERAFY